MTRRRVLIIDDHADSASMLATLLGLRNPGLSMEVAADGESGLALVLAQQPDVVIIDLSLPGMDGAQVAIQIRRMQLTAAPVLVALSGSVADIAHHQHGQVFDHALTKPVNVARLLDILS